MADEPINLADRRAAREAPDADCIRKDEYGRPLYRFGFEFRHFDGDEYGFDVWAYDMPSAEEIAASINANGVRLVGQLFATVPA